MILKFIPVVMNLNDSSYYGASSKEDAYEKMLRLKEKNPDKNYSVSYLMTADDFDLIDIL